MNNFYDAVLASTAKQGLCLLLCLLMFVSCCR